jgi:hypothetical protein
MMTNQQVVQLLCKELGRLTLANHAAAVEASPILRLFRRDLTRDFKPGDQITNLAANFVVPAELLAQAGPDARDSVGRGKLIEFLKTERANIVPKFFPLIERTFRGYANQGKPEAWRAVRVPMNWFSEMVVGHKDGSVVVYVDLSFGFEPRVNEAPEIDIDSLGSVL